MKKDYNLVLEVSSKRNINIYTFDIRVHNSGYCSISEPSNAC